DTERYSFACRKGNGAHMASEPDEHAFSVAADDGTAIAAWRWQGAARPRAVVQIAHGMGEHSLRYRRFAAALVAAGYAVYANDHRGHGRTAPDRSQLGDFGAGGFAALGADMLALTRLAQAEHAGRPLVLLGHSMGSIAAQLYILDHSAHLAGVV